MPNGRDYQERDKERIGILSSVGWRCIATVRWSIFMSLAIDERSKFLSSLKQAIYDASIVNLEYSYLLSPKYEQLLKRDIAIKSGKVNSLGRKCPFKITNEEMNFRKEAILNSGIDLSKFGWVEKVSKATGLTRRQIYKVVNSTDLINYVYRR